MNESKRVKIKYKIETQLHELKTQRGINKNCLPKPSMQIVPTLMFSMPHIVYPLKMQVQSYYNQITAEERSVENGKLAHKSRTFRSKITTEEIRRFNRIGSAHWECEWRSEEKDQQSDWLIEVEYQIQVQVTYREKIVWYLTFERVILSVLQCRNSSDYYGGRCQLEAECLPSDWSSLGV